MKPVSLLTLALISSAAAQVMPPGMPQGMQMMQMAAPSPPRPGDASMTCEQIAREMGEFIKKSDISKNAAQNRKAGCALRGTSSLSAAEQNRATATVMGNAMTTMSTFNNPRLMRLGILAQEKNCTANAPPPKGDTKEPVDACADFQPENAHKQPSPPTPRGSTIHGDPFQAPSKTNTVDLGASDDPFAPKPAAVAPAPPKRKNK